MSKGSKAYGSQVLDKIFDGHDDYVIIRIGEKSGKVKVFSIDNTIQSKGQVGNDIDDLEPFKVGQKDLSKGIEFIDAAFWYKASPICVIHGNKRY